MKTKMTWKIWTLILVLFAGVAFTACDDEEEEVDLVNNPEQRQEVFNQILNNPQVYDDFMNEMRNNTNAMGRMMENPDFTNQMWQEENMNRMREHNPETDQHMMDNTLNRMENDTAFANEMNRQMQQRKLFHEGAMAR